MLDERKSAILRAVVQEYIETAQPVGRPTWRARGTSGCRRPPSATRWRCSSGRVFSPTPTPAPAASPPTRATGSSSTTSAPAAGRSSRPTSSRCSPSSPRPTARSRRCCTTPAACCPTSPTTPPSSSPPATRTPPCGRCRSCGLGARVALVVAVLSNGAVEKATIELAEEAATSGWRRPAPTWPPTWSGCRSSTTARCRPPATSAPTPWPPPPAPPCSSCHKHEAEQVFVGGASQMAATFEAVATVRQVLTILEQQYVLVTLLQEALSDVPEGRHRLRARRRVAGRVLGRRRPLRGRRPARRHHRRARPHPHELPPGHGRGGRREPAARPPPERELTRGPDRRLLRAARRQPRRHRGRAQEGLPQPGPRAPPRRQRRRRRCRGAVQAGHARLRDPARPGAPAPLRHVRSRRASRHRRGGAGSAALRGPVRRRHLGDIFESFFGGGSPFGGGGGSRGPAGPPRGNDIEVAVDLDFREAVFGASHEVTVRVPVGLPDLLGHRRPPGTTPMRCAQCGGAGEVRRVRQSILGQMVTASPCPRCNGMGEEIASPCPDCRGEGRRTDERTYTVEVPAGVDDSRTLKIAGLGAAGPRGGPAGDLYVHIRVRPDERFARHGNDLVHELHVPMTQAALGAHLRYETLDGVEDLVIPKGTQTGKVFRLRGRGVPRLGGGGAGATCSCRWSSTPPPTCPRSRRSCCGCWPTPAAKRWRRPTPASSPRSARRSSSRPVAVTGPPVTGLARRVPGPRLRRRRGLADAGGDRPPPPREGAAAARRRSGDGGRRRRVGAVAGVPVRGAASGARRRGDGRAAGRPRADGGVRPDQGRPPGVGGAEADRAGRGQDRAAGGRPLGGPLDGRPGGVGRRAAADGWPGRRPCRAGGRGCRWWRTWRRSRRHRGGRARPWRWPVATPRRLATPLVLVGPEGGWDDEELGVGAAHGGARARASCAPRRRRWRRGRCWSPSVPGW